MVTGHLQEKKGYYYAVLTYKNAQGNRATKWIATGLSAKGNRRKAEAILEEARMSFVPEEPLAEGDMLFADYLLEWLETVKSTIALTTYSSYGGLIRTPIEPWFRNKKVTLKNLTARMIQEFYTEQLERVSPNTLIHYHVVLHRALRYAVKVDLLDVNPADKVERPKKVNYRASYYGRDELNQLFDVIEGTLLEVPVKLAAFYGLRRSEVLGLKWNAIDFERGTVMICHTVTSCNANGKKLVIAADTTKTKSSRRTLPLMEPVREMLLNLRARQAEYRRLCGNCYCRDYEDYICVNEMGYRMQPAWLSKNFDRMLESKGMRHIRLHDLRHSCASLLLMNGVTLKQIQEWLGHSDFSTTANIYAHLDPGSGQSTAAAMLRGLGYPE